MPKAQELGLEGIRQLVKDAGNVVDVTFSKSLALDEPLTVTYRVEGDIVPGEEAGSVRAIAAFKGRVSANRPPVTTYIEADTDITPASPTHLLRIPATAPLRIR